MKLGFLTSVAVFGVTSVWAAQAPTGQAPGTGVRERAPLEVALTVPVGLALEFIDGTGQIRWTADSDGWAVPAPSRQRVTP